MSQASASVSLRSGDGGVGDRTTTTSLETYLAGKSSVTERLASGNTASPQEALSRLQAKKRAVDALVQKVKGQ